MISNKRRQQLLEFLKEQGQQPVSASALASKFEVSRQIIVGDVALLRAAGADISATPRGYLLHDDNVQPNHSTHIIACCHDELDLREELYTIVDFGCGVLEVIVEHPVYGQLSAPLHIFSRYDADQFCDKLKKDMAPPLSTLTGGVHLHRISCPTEDAYKKMLEHLKQKGILLKKNG